MKNNYGFLSGNVLKIIALITMTIDHIGYIMFPGVVWLRIIGRLAFPIFAYLIAEGCKYTKNKLKYFLFIFILGLFCQLFAYFLGGQTELNILLTFSFSIAIVYLLMWIKQSIKAQNKKHTVFSIVCFALSVVGVYLLTNDSLSFALIKVDYGFWGIMVPVFVSFFDHKYLKLLVFTVSLILVCLCYGFTQWFCLLSIVLISWYNGERGKLNLKYLFYIYYPVHLAIIYVIAWLI